MDTNGKTFTYTYSASQQAELMHIREKYATPTEEEDKMEQLRKLDASVTQPGMIAALAEGVISTLVMGFGMCCTMVWADTLFVPGIVIGIIGIAGICVAYPLYICITNRRRNKIAPEIMRLADELRQSTAAQIGRGVAKAETQTETRAPKQPARATFQAVKGKYRQ